MANTFLATQGLGLITGTITYDPATKTMTLDNVTANGEPYALVYVKTVGSLTYGSGKAAIEPIPRW